MKVLGKPFRLKNLKEMLGVRKVTSRRSFGLRLDLEPDFLIRYYLGMLMIGAELERIRDELLTTRQWKRSELQKIIALPDHLHSYSKADSSPEAITAYINGINNALLILEQHIASIMIKTCSPRDSQLEFKKKPSSTPVRKK